MLRTRVFYRIIASFVVLVVLATVAMGSAALFFSNRAVETEAMRSNNLLRANVVRMLTDGLIYRVGSIYIDMSMPRKNSQIFQLYSSENYTQRELYLAWEILEENMNYHSDLVHSIFIYEPRNQVVVAVPEGIADLSDTHVSAKDFSWLLDVEPHALQWLHAATDAQNPESRVLMYLHRYPMVSSARASGYLGISIQYETINAMLEGMDDMHIALVDANGQIFASNNKELMGTSWSTIAADAPAEGASVTDRVQGELCLVGSTPLGATGLSVVTWVSLAHSLSGARQLVQLFVLAGIGILLIGIFAAYALSSRIYHPLRSIVNAIPSLFKRTDKGRENEYEVINNVINELSVKVSQLNRTLAHNLPAMKHSFVMALTTGAQLGQEELRFYREVLSLSEDTETWQCALFEIEGGHAGELSFENNRYVLYQLSEELEAFASARLLTAVPGDGHIAVVGRAGHTLEALSAACAFAKDNFGLRCIAAIGIPRADTEPLHRDYALCQQLLADHFLFPDVQVFALAEHESRLQQRAPLSPTWVARAMAALDMGDADALRGEILELQAEMKRGHHAVEVLAEEPAQLIEKLLSRATGADLPHPGEAHTLDEYIRRLMGLAEQALAAATPPTARHPAIQSACAYIEENLSQDIAQSTLAESLGFNPRYFSKLFKEEIGQNFSEYINELRLARACAWLTETQWSIGEICEKAGYHSSSYFTRVFRQRFDQSPQDFRRSALSRRVHSAGKEEAV